MKKILIVSVYSCLLLQANDIERINLLVKEVKHLQSNYTMCQKKLFILEDRLKKNSNASIEICAKELSKEHENFINLQNKCESKQEDKSLEMALVHNLKKKIEHGENELVKKEMQIKKLQAKIDIYSKKSSAVKELDQKLLEEKKKNLILQEKLKTVEKKLAFLQQKKKSKRKKKEFTCKKIVSVVQKEIQHLTLTKDNHIAIQKQVKLVFSRPKTFRTKLEADIYDSVNGKKIAKWVKGRSFTSYVSSGNWIKITGYFIDKKWTEASSEMWIKKEDAFER